MVKLHVIRADTRDVGERLVRVPAGLSGATAVEWRGRDVPAEVNANLGGNEIAIDQAMRSYLNVVLGKEYDFIVHATEEPEAREAGHLEKLVERAQAAKLPMNLELTDVQDALEKEFDRGGEKAARRWLDELYYYGKIWIQEETERRK